MGIDAAIGAHTHKFTRIFYCRKTVQPISCYSVVFLLIMVESLRFEVLPAQLSLLVKTPSMVLSNLLERAANFEFLSIEEGVYLYHHAPLTDLMFVADSLRKRQVPHGKVTWQIDRNVNTTRIASSVTSSVFRVIRMPISRRCRFIARRSRRR